MKSLKLASTYFVIAYLVATVFGTTLYYIDETVMWIGLFTLMPILFGYFIFRYLLGIECYKDEALTEVIRVISFWIATAFFLDALVYIVIFPLFFGFPVNLRFFVDQSPWIWLNYAVLVLSGLGGFRWYKINYKNNISKH